MHILYEIFAALKDATLVQNRRFINDCLKQNYSFKGKQKQTKNLNAVKSQIEELKLKRQQHQTKFSHFKDELWEEGFPESLGNGLHNNIPINLPTEYHPL